MDIVTTDLDYLIMPTTENKKTLPYIDPSIFDPSFQIKTLGIRHIPNSSIFNRPAGLDDFLMILFYTPVFTNSNKEIKEQKANTLIIWPPGEPQYYGLNDNKPWNHSWMLFNGTKVSKWIQDGSIPYKTPILLRDPALFDWYLLAIHQELTTRSTPSAQIITNFTENLFMEIARDNSDESTHPQIPNDYLTIRFFIEENYLEPLSISRLAAKVNQSAPHFCRLFKRYYSIAPMEYVYRLRLHHAANLLGDPSLRISEIAHQSGYPDEYYFSRAFKRHFGQSPSSMRNRPASPSDNHILPQGRSHDV